MATDVDVQYFSHLNGLVLGNNWGDLIRLLDKALVTGIDFTQITAASIDAQGDVHITLYSDHNAMLFQVVELTGFAPASFNQKYRIKGVPSTTELILKPHTAIIETSITTVGAGKLASLGYEIIFRDTNDVKRVYRAKNPTAQHPFIRVDESLTSPNGTTGVYTSTYAKFAMVGLLEHMEHIDDFENSDVLQLPFDPTNPAKNWKITGTGSNVVRGWSRWYWAAAKNGGVSYQDTISPLNGNRPFSIAGDSDAFYFMPTIGDYNGIVQQYSRALFGTGLFESAIDDSIIPPWFLMSKLLTINANSSYSNNDTGATPLGGNTETCAFYVCAFNETAPLSSNILTRPITPNYTSGRTNLYANDGACIQIPILDNSNVLRGNLKHILYSGRNLQSTTTVTKPYLQGDYMYMHDLQEINITANTYNAYPIYLGELGQ